MIRMQKQKVRATQDDATVEEVPTEVNETSAAVLESADALTDEIDALLEEVAAAAAKAALPWWHPDAEFGPDEPKPDLSIGIWHVISWLADNDPTADYRSFARAVRESIDTKMTAWYEARGLVWDPCTC